MLYVVSCSLFTVSLEYWYLPVWAIILNHHIDRVILTTQNKPIIIWVSLDRIINGAPRYSTFTELITNFTYYTTELMTNILLGTAQVKSWLPSSTTYVGT